MMFIKIKNMMTKENIVYNQIDLPHIHCLNKDFVKFENIIVPSANKLINMVVPIANHQQNSINNTNITFTNTKAIPPHQQSQPQPNKPIIHKEFLSKKQLRHEDINIAETIIKMGDYNKKNTLFENHSKEKDDDYSNRKDTNKPIVFTEIDCKNLLKKKN